MIRVNCKRRKTIVTSELQTEVNVQVPRVVVPELLALDAETVDFTAGGSFASTETCSDLQKCIDYKENKVQSC